MFRNFSRNTFCTNVLTDVSCRRLKYARKHWKVWRAQSVLQCRVRFLQSRWRSGTRSRRVTSWPLWVQWRWKWSFSLQLQGSSKASLSRREWNLKEMICSWTLNRVALINGALKTYEMKFWPGFVFESGTSSKISGQELCVWKYGWKILSACTLRTSHSMEEAKIKMIVQWFA